MGHNGVPLVGWAGSLQHVVSWRESGMWSRVPENCVVEVMDHMQVFMALKPYVMARFIPYAITVQAYLERVATWDAYLIPMAGEYDRRKSWVKALDACYAGVPWISDGDVDAEVYRDVPFGKSLEWLKDGWTGLTQERVMAVDWAEHRTALRVTLVCGRMFWTIYKGKGV